MLFYVLKFGSNLMLKFQQNCGMIWEIVTRYWINDLEKVRNTVARFWIIIYEVLICGTT